MSIVPATTSDLARIVELLEEVNLPHDDLSTEALSHFHVLRREGTVQGVVGLEPVGDAAVLRSLAVAPDARGNGHGGALVQAVESYGEQLDLRTLFLLTTTAVDFFSALGYRQTHRCGVPASVQATEEFRRICPDTATCMQKSLIS